MHGEGWNGDYGGNVSLLEWVDFISASIIMGDNNNCGGVMIGISSKGCPFYNLREEGEVCYMTIAIAIPLGGQGGAYRTEDCVPFMQ